MIYNRKRLLSYEMTGTRMIERIISRAPALIGDARLSGRLAAALMKPPKLSLKNVKMHICATVEMTPSAKLTQTAAFVVFLLNSPQRNGPRNEPESAPQE